MSSPENPAPPPTLQGRFERALIFVLLATIVFSFPNKPEFDLDASWRMALGKFFIDGLQFGRDIVFTYGPLGFLMGKTYSGLLFWSLLVWQAFASVVIATLVMHTGRRVAPGLSRFCYYGFFLLFGLCYEDAMHMVVIALIGFELVRRVDRPWHWSSALMLLVLAVQSVAKFTNLVLATIMVLTIGALALWQHRRGAALRLFAWFGGGFLVCWLLCRQNLLNLPAYLINSWHVSQGYQEVMGIPTPFDPLWKALAVILLLTGYALLNIFTQPDRPRSVARGVMLGALVYLNWKHGFVRADGHMVGFFYCALLPIVAYPALLEDAGPFGRLKRGTLVLAGGLCLLGIRDAIPPVVDTALSLFQDKVWRNFDQTAHLATLRQDYDNALSRERLRYDLPRTRKVIGNRSVDVLGFNQAVAIYNQFNYRPRPVFQSYSAYTPELARLNAAFYESDRAPDFVLIKVGSIDDRLPAVDDSAVLYLITQRYSYVLSEKSFQLWVRAAVPFDPAARPQLLQQAPLAVGQPFPLPASPQPLWAEIDLRPSWLGRLRNFLYKPPLLQLVIEDATGRSSIYRLPAPIGRAGFILSPVIDDLMAFTRYITHHPERLARQITLQVAPEDRKYFAATADLKLSSLRSPVAHTEYADMLNRERFYMFNSVPISVDSTNLPSNEQIDGVEMMVVHAPSEMTFDLPKGATTASGRFGLLTSAYTNGNRTNGAEFVIVWSNGKDSVELFHQLLEPLWKPSDRGLTSFRVDVSKFNGGRLYFRTLPGPDNDVSWDWTAWTDIDIK